MKVLVCFRNGPHSHDYQVQGIFSGFKELLGETNVLDHPSNPFCHLPEITPGSRLPNPAFRDECNLDSDCAYPIVQVDPPFDLIIAGAHAPDESHEAIKNNPGAAIAWIDGSDTSAQNCGPGVNFKRELPIGVAWAHPLPLTYPSIRIPKVEVDRYGVVYYASIHGGVASDRMRIAADLSQIDGARVHTTSDQKLRPSPEAHHRELWSALVGIHWNPVNPLDKINSNTSGYCGNRLWENLAFGTAVVALRPFITIPNPFTDGKNIVYVDSSNQVVVKVKELLSDPKRAQRIGRAGHEHFLKYHCAEARAKYIIEKCGLTL